MHQNSRKPQHSWILVFSLLTMEYIGVNEPHRYDDEVHGIPLNYQQHFTDWKVSDRLQQGNSQ